MKKIAIIVDDISVTAELNDSLTAQQILHLLPIEGTVNVWGEEIYFNIPLEIELEADAREEVDVGDLGYWPSGPAFCIFFGPTPVSKGEKPRAYSPVSVFGRITEDATRFRSVKSGAKILVKRAD